MYISEETLWPPQDGVNIFKKKKKKTAFVMIVLVCLLYKCVFYTIMFSILCIVSILHYQIKDSESTMITLNSHTGKLQQQRLWPITVWVWG